MTRILRRIISLISILFFISVKEVEGNFKCSPIQNDVPNSEKLLSQNGNTKFLPLSGMNILTKYLSSALNKQQNCSKSIKTRELPFSSRFVAFRGSIDNHELIHPKHYSNNKQHSTGTHVSTIETKESKMKKSIQTKSYAVRVKAENEDRDKDIPTTLFSPDDSLREIPADTFHWKTNDILDKKENRLRSPDNAEELFVPQIPLSAGEEYFVGGTTFGNDSRNFDNNCTGHNDSCEENQLHAPVLGNGTLGKAIVLLVIGFFSVIGNIATLASILRMGRQSTSTVYMLLVQLAIADLLVTIFCILTDAVWMLTVQWYADNALCKVVKFMQMFSLYMSTFILVLIGFDRLSAVRFPMNRARAKHHVRKGIICVWTLSAAFSTPQVLIFSVMRGPFVEDFYQCVTYAFYTAAWQEQLYTTLSLVFMFLLPLIILIVTYITTFITIASQENMFSERVTKSVMNDARSKILHKAKIKSLMITVVIVLAFVVCWTPYYVTMIVFVFLEPDEDTGQTLQSIVFFFGSSTAAINPLIYGAFHLRRKKPRTKSKRSSGNSSSSRMMETTLLTTFRRGSHRKSREEHSDMV